MNKYWRNIDDVNFEPSFFRNKFTHEEDQKLIKLVGEYKGRPHWRTISGKISGKSARQCRERYNNYLNPSLQHTEWTNSEDETILEKHQIHGNKWNEIAKALPGRTGNGVRNRYFQLIRKSK